MQGLGQQGSIACQVYTSLTLLGLSDGPLPNASADAPTNASFRAVKFKSVNPDEAVNGLHKLRTLTPLARKAGFGATQGLPLCLL